jgi:Mg/Co/Ni transporter MgtE
MDVLMYIYITDPAGMLTGVLDIRELLAARDDSRLSEIMTENIVSLSPGNTLKDAFSMFNRYGFRALPVIDQNGVILGVVPYRDVMNLKHRTLG